MWSEVNNEYVKSLVESNRGVYPYYVAHTCTYWGIGNTYDKPSFKVYFSKEPIKADGRYTYVFSDDYVCYSVISSNANSSYNNARVSTSEYSAGALTVDDYEFIYTNAEFEGSTIQPDITASSEISQSHFDAFSLILLCVLLTVAVVRLISR